MEKCRRLIIICTNPLIFVENRKLMPFYDLLMSITGEELGHVELVSHGINSCLRGSTSYKEPDKTPLETIKDARFSYHFLAGAQGAMPFDSMGNPSDRCLMCSTAGTL